MQVKQFHSFFQNALTEVYSSKEALIIGSWLLEDRLGIEPGELRQMEHAIIDETIMVQIRKDIEELKTLMPIQYLLQKSQFYHLNFFVNNSVLIPRPETEELVDWVIKSHEKTSELEILDIGTGSGCIAISLKKNLVHASVRAFDISESALSIAKKNAANNGASVDFIHADILNPESCSHLPLFDCIVSNPPYIPIGESTNMQQQVVTQEPHLALFVPNENPLVFYEAIAKFAKSHLSANGKVFVEINQQLHQETAAVFDLHFHKVEVKKDINNNYRMLMATQLR